MDSHIIIWNLKKIITFVPATCDKLGMHACCTPFSLLQNTSLKWLVDCLTFSYTVLRVHPVYARFQQMQRSKCWIRTIWAGTLDWQTINLQTTATHTSVSLASYIKFRVHSFIPASQTTTCTNHNIQTKVWRAISYTFLSTHWFSWAELRPCKVSWQGHIAGGETPPALERRRQRFAQIFQIRDHGCGVGALHGKRGMLFGAWIHLQRRSGNS